MKRNTKWQVVQAYGEDQLLEPVIFVLGLCWLVSFFDQSLIPGVPHTPAVTDMLAVVLGALILFHFLT